MSVLLATILLVSATEAAAGAPPAVPAYVARRAGCNHWSGEDGYDAERGREIARALATLRCGSIGRDERLLTRRYARDRTILRLLAQAKNADGE